MDQWPKKLNPRPQLLTIRQILSPGRGLIQRLGHAQDPYTYGMGLRPGESELAYFKQLHCIYVNGKSAMNPMMRVPRIKARDGICTSLSALRNTHLPP